MIKVGIIGCANLRAAELVRVLINHPDVELKWARDAGVAGLRLDAIVPGVVGECDLTVDDDGDLDGVDVVFLCGSRAEVTRRLARLHIPEGVRLIDLSGSHNLDYGDGKPGPMTWARCSGGCSCMRLATSLCQAMPQLLRCWH